MAKRNMLSFKIRRGKKVRRSIAFRRPKAGLVPLIKKVVNNQVETKYSATVPDGWLQIYADTAPTAAPVQMWSGLADVMEGVAEYKRTGVKIRPVKCCADLMFAFNQQSGDLTGNLPSGDAWDLTVHIWYGYVRKFKQQAGIDADITNVIANLLENGNGVTQRFQGRQSDLLNEVNKEYFNVKHTSFRMCKQAGNANLATSVGGAAVDQAQPETTLVTKRLSFTPPASLMYNETNVFPENYAPMFIVGYAHNDGTQGANARASPVGSYLNVPAIQMTYASKLWFKDA